MIGSFACKKTQAVFEGRRGDRKWDSFRRVTERKLKMLHAAAKLSDLKAPPNNRLEKLGRDREGQHSIRISDQWRICFIWNDGRAERVEICDYH